MVAPDEAALSAVDHGITVGDGVFETCAVLDGHAFALTRHLARLGALGGRHGHGGPRPAKVRDGVDAVLAAAPDAGRLRITVTDGVGPLGSGRSDGPQTVVVAATDAVVVPTGRAARSPWTRNENSAVAGLKTTSYAENVVALPTRSERAPTSRCSRTRGRPVRGHRLERVPGDRRRAASLPPLSVGCLAGITRELLLEWGARGGAARARGQVRAERRLRCRLGWPLRRGPGMLPDRVGAERAADGVARRRGPAGSASSRRSRATCSSGTCASGPTPDRLRRFGFRIRARTRLISSTHALTAGRQHGRLAQG